MKRIVLLVAMFFSIVLTLRAQDAHDGALEQLQALCDSRYADCPSAVPVASPLPRAVDRQAQAVPETAIIDGMVTPLIPYFLNLKDGDWLPEHATEAYDNRLVAASLVRRLGRQEDESADNPDYDYYKDTKVQIAFWDKIIELVGSGCFKNQHQTHSSSGMLGEDTRASAEDRMIKVRLEPQYQYNAEDPVHKIRPKYAYLGLQKPKPGLISRFDSLYGNVVAVLKDEVKDRTTFSPGDSLEVDDKRVYTMRYRSAAPMKLQAVYWEAQVWGELCVRDVAYFLVNCEYLSEVNPSAIERLKALGRPIYQCAVGHQDRFLWLHPGALIYSPAG